MKPIQQIKKPKWMCCSETTTLMRLISGEEAIPSSMFVGGCVRNELLDEPVVDIDIATKFFPEEIIEKLSKSNIKVIPTGIKHGTVTAVIKDKNFEITTLRQDTQTDGRHADIAYTDDWVVDAMRRDFTMNTLLADMAGNIYDPLAKGISDLQAKRIVFVGDPAKRIQEDYLRILRFFRFYVYYGKGDMDQDALKACQENAEGIKNLSNERIMQEFLKILANDNASKVIKVMFAHDILDDMADKDFQLISLEKLCDVQRKYKAIDVMTRLFVLGGNKPRLFEDHLRLSHAQKNFLIKLDMVTRSPFFENNKELKKAIFYHGRELILQGYLLTIVRQTVRADTIKINIINDWQIPKCPITGATLISEGYQTGPELGQELKHRQEEWLEENI